MFTSDTEKRAALPLKTALVYLGVSLFCALFGGVYEAFSHGVYSYCMLYAFAFPLVLGTAPYLLLSYRRVRIRSAAAQSIWHAGVATLTVGSIVNGALQIYGTTNPLTAVYWILGGAMLLLASVLVLAAGKKRFVRAAVQ